MPNPDFLEYPLHSAISATATSAVMDVGAYPNFTVQLVDTGADIGGADSLQIQESNDGATWVSLGLAMTAEGIREDTCNSQFLRTVFTVDTGSNLSVYFCAKP